MHLWGRNMKRKTEEIWCKNGRNVIGIFTSGVEIWKEKQKKYVWCKKWENYDWNIHLWGQLHYPPLNLGLQLASCCLQLRVQLSIFQLGGKVEYFSTGFFLVDRVFSNWGVKSAIFQLGNLVQYFPMGGFQSSIFRLGVS